MKILIAERLAQAGVKLFEEQPGWQTIISNAREFEQYLGEADALIVRNSVKVTADMLARAPRLRVIGRAGVGTDNLDLAAASAAGVLVMNTPGGNAVSVAEHTLALMLSLARCIPQASASIRAGQWNRRKFVGSELRGKVLGVIGLGSIGRAVVRRAKAFDMRIVATDPFVNPRTADDVGAELIDLDLLYAQADYITLHTALTPASQRMLSSGAFAKMKRGVRIVNCARGELVDQKALQDALESGQVAGAALDVLEKEPPDPHDPLLASERVIVTPHIGGSTEEAQDIVAHRIATQVIEFLRHGVAAHALNMPALTPEQFRTIEPFSALAERLGSLASHIAQGNPKLVRLTYFGKIAEHNTQLVRNSGVAGVVNRSVAQRANAINAMQLAEDRGLTVVERHDRRAGHTDSVRLELETGGAMTTVDGAVVLGRPHLLQVDGIRCSAPLTGNITILKSADVPGVIGHVGAVLGRYGVNVANFSLGRREAGSEAVSVIATDQPVSEEMLNELLKNPAIRLARAVQFGETIPG